MPDSTHDDSRDLAAIAHVLAITVRDNRTVRSIVSGMIRGHGWSVGQGDLDALTELLALQAVLDEAIREAVDGQRTYGKRSWTDIGRAAGTTRQAAHERWGTPVEITRVD